MKEKIIKPFKLANGQMAIEVEDENGNPLILELRYLIAKMCLATPPKHEELFVIHKDGNKENNSPENLRWSDVDEK